MTRQEVENQLPNDYKCYSNEIHTNMVVYDDSFSDAVCRRFSHPLAQQDILGK